MNTIDPMPETEPYRRYCMRLCALVHTELVPKVATFDYFTRYAQDSNPDFLDVEPVINMFVSGMTYDVYLSIYRLLVARSGDRNIPKFLEFTKANIEIIRFNRQMTLEMIEKHEKLIASIQPQLRKLKRMRDKFFAHYDDEYFFDPDVMIEQVPFSNSDALGLVRVMQRIMGDHHEACKGSKLLSLEGAFYVGAERVCDAMLKAAREDARRRDAT